MADGKESKKAVIEPCPPNSRVLFNVTSSYVFESDFKRGHDASGDAWQNDIQFGYRIPLGEGWPGEECGEWNLRLGAEYSRFDFGNKGGLPIPNHLQGVAGVIALEYLVKGDLALLLETHPGVYFENDIDSDSFDAPTVIGGSYRFNDHFVGVIGATFASMREYPIIPGVGFIWTVNDQWTVSALYPQPRVIYKPDEHCSFYAGGEFVGGSFRVDDAKGRPAKLDRAVVSYSEYRAGLGFTYQSGPVSLEVGGGYAFQREFDFHRADRAYRTDEGAPYVKVELRTAF
jgi:hypothetical protein